MLPAHRTHAKNSGILRGRWAHTDHGYLKRTARCCDAAEAGGFDGRIVASQFRHRQAPACRHVQETPGLRGPRGRRHRRRVDARRSSRRPGAFVPRLAGPSQAGHALRRELPRTHEDRRLSLVPFARPGRVGRDGTRDRDGGRDPRHHGQARSRGAGRRRTAALREGVPPLARAHVAHGARRCAHPRRERGFPLVFRLCARGPSGAHDDGSRHPRGLGGARSRRAPPARRGKASRCGVAGAHRVGRGAQRPGERGRGRFHGRHVRAGDLQGHHRPPAL